MNAIDLARQFHEAYERLAPSFGYETRAETRQFDPESPNGKLMTAVCSEIGETCYLAGMEQAAKLVETFASGIVPENTYRGEVRGQTEFASCIAFTAAEHVDAAIRARRRTVAALREKQDEGC